MAPTIALSRTGTLAVLALLTASLLGGCIGGGDEADKKNDQGGGGGGDDGGVAPDATFSAETGAIEGHVFNEISEPLSGVQIGLRVEGEGEFIQNADTDADGVFTFSELQPGKYEILASKVGFDDLKIKTEVTAGQVARLEQITMQQLASAEPFSVLVPERGIFGCGASWKYPIPPSPPDPVPTPPWYTGIAACGLLSDVEGAAQLAADQLGQPNPVNMTQYDRFLILWTVGKIPHTELDASVFEMQWTTNQVLGRGMAMRWETETCFNSGPDCEFARASGYSPLRVWTNATKMQDAKEASGACEGKKIGNCTIMSRVFTIAETAGGGSEVDLGVAFQQPYEMWMSLFFREPARDDFSAFNS